MKPEIVKKLNGIENQYNVKIILASESGSRAWGFPSVDSDYDVRFIYVHRPDWYLSIVEKKDTIDLPLDDVFDINGWDLRKSLVLMRKSNSPLLEWLSSPIQYKIWLQAYNKLLSLSKAAFMPETSCHHYLSMARKSIEKIESSEKIKAKTYMYAIRPILCCEWIISNLTQPPMHISDLLAATTDMASFKDQVINLIEKKGQHSEKYTVNRSKVIDNYINEKLVELQGSIPENHEKTNTDKFDDVFRYILSRRES